MSETVDQPVTETPKQTTEEELISHLKKSKQIHDAFAKQFKNRYCTFDGTRLEDWKEQFQIDIPGDATPRICMEVGGKLNKLTVEATSHKTDAESRYTSLKAAYEDKFRKAFTTVVYDYKNSGQKLPAKDTLTQLAEHQVAVYKESLVHAEIEIAFWKDILGQLYTARKLLQNTTWNISIEAKAFGDDKQIENVTRSAQRNNGGHYE